jgi:hypothetical protein
MWTVMRRVGIRKNNVHGTALGPRWDRFLLLPPSAWEFYRKFLDGMGVVGTLKSQPIDASRLVVVVGIQIHKGRGGGFSKASNDFRLFGRRMAEISSFSEDLVIDRRFLTLTSCSYVP